ncbi:hypothetical protein GQS52_16655 [Streptomyces sp. SCUT-3]|uniref:hypothetical protein n=1 Tax=Streptomyces TaxID=1883 RepID=UPI0015F8CDE0|nr:MULTISPECIES: hypothetical protein [unclassified Streptomyces]MCZ2526735.1 hypothetical protein [Streptomyces sp. HB2AG]QMV23132.1 hypothetical protein GQS52_16655 [Streptomyces sp. SCUT-3]
MTDCTPLLDAVDRIADRFRSLPQSRLLAAADGGGASRAALGLELARTLAASAQREEFPGAEPRRIPDLGVFAIGDQIAVAGHDLAAALAAGGGREGASPGEASREDVLQEALRAVAETTRRCGL